LTVNCKTIIGKAIIAMQKALTENTGATSIAEIDDMHKVFAETLSFSNSLGYLLRKGTYAVIGKGSMIPDFLIVGPNHNMAFIELKFVDSAPKSTVRALLRKQGAAKDIGLLTHPHISDFERYMIIGIRWDLEKTRREATRKYKEDAFLISCKNDIRIACTNFARLESMSYIQRGYIFGQHFCFDFSLLDFEKEVEDISGYRRVRNSKAISLRSRVCRRK